MRTRRASSCAGKRLARDRRRRRTRAIACGCAMQCGRPATERAVRRRVRRRIGDRRVFAGHASQRSRRSRGLRARRSRSKRSRTSPGSCTCCIRAAAAPRSTCSRSYARRAREFRHYFLRVSPDRWLFKDAIGEHGAACEWPRDVASEALPAHHVRVARHRPRARAQPRRQRRRSRAHARFDRASVLLLGARHVRAVPDGLPDRRVRQVLQRDDRPRRVHGMPRAASMRFARSTSPPGARVTRAFLRGAAKVWAPSHWAGDTLRKYYPERGSRYVRIPSKPMLRCAARRGCVRLPRGRCIATSRVLGAIGPEKGARIIDALVDEIRERVAAAAHRRHRLHRSRETLAIRRPRAHDPRLVWARRASGAVRALPHRRRLVSHHLAGDLQLHAERGMARRDGRRSCRLAARLPSACRQRARVG